MHKQSTVFFSSLLGCCLVSEFRHIFRWWIAFNGARRLLTEKMGLAFHANVCSFLLPLFLLLLFWLLLLLYVFIFMERLRQMTSYYNWNARNSLNQVKIVTTMFQKSSSTTTITDAARDDEDGDGDGSDTALSNKSSHKSL